MLFIDSNSSKRSKDENGFLIIKDNPIAKAGVFDYLLSEIESDVKEADDEIVRVCRTFDELKRVKDNFANKPIKFTHLWVGDENKQADGAIGLSLIIKKPFSSLLRLVKLLSIKSILIPFTLKSHYCPLKIVNYSKL